MHFSSNFFTKNRQGLFSKMRNNSIMILVSNNQYPKNGDQQFAFRQQSDLYYLTGIKQEKTSLILSKTKEGEKREYIFILKPNPKLETWEGKKLDVSEAQSISGIKNVFWDSDFEQSLNKNIQSDSLIYLLGEDAFAQKSTLHLSHIALQKNIQKNFSSCIIKSPRSILNALRLIKSEEEITMLQQAVDITKKAYQQVLKTVQSDIAEYEVEAEISYIFRKNGANGHAYDPIIATGLNACSLHYVKNNSYLKKGDLLLMDFGADYNYYSADLSRTIPVDGIFSSRQKELYQLVLDIQKKAIPLFVPGNTINIVNEKVNILMTEALKSIGLLKKKDDLQKYYPHGVTHFLGIDVHDVGTKDTIFEEGMVLTCEPGLYVQEESIGIRIENDIVVGKEPKDLTKNIIREISEIEKYMNS